MDLNFNDKVFLVTGGASGIGEAICRLIAKEGGIAVIADRNFDKATLLHNEIQSLHRRSFPVQVELTADSACRQLMETVIHQFGQLDGLVNNAGTNDNVSLADGSAAAFRESININVVHYYEMTHYALPYLKKSKGAVINIGSKISVTGQGGSSGYAAGKGAVNALTREWAVELLPYEIRVNAVIPAEVDTPQYASWIQTQPDSAVKLKSITSHIPFQRRFTSPDEIANMVAFLLSNASSHTTGQIVFVDGGYTHLDRMII